MNILNVPIYVLLEEVMQAEDIAGLVINPFGQSMVLPKNIVEMVLNHLLLDVLDISTATI